MRLLSLCSGYGGLDVAVESVLGCETVAYAEVDAKAASVFARHWPHAEPLGDLTAVDWTAWAGEVDVLAAGFPCQDLSHAGKGAGLKAGTRSGLWYAIEAIIETVRPRMVVLENVAAIKTAKGLVDDGPGRCLCGWTYRWGGVHLHHEGGAQLRPSDRCGDDEGGPSTAAPAARPVGRALGQEPGGDGALGGSVAVGSRRASMQAVPSGDRTAPATKAGAVRAGLGAVQPTGVADSPGWAESDVDTGGVGPSPVDEGSHEGAEREGAAGGCEAGVVCPACGRPLDTAPGEPVDIRALGVVLRGLARLGLHGKWRCLRAADVGAPHGRKRWFLVATDAGGQRHGGSPVGPRAGSVGCLDGADAGEARQRQRARQEPGDRGAEAPANPASVGRAEGRTGADGRRAATRRAAPVANATGDTGRLSHGDVETITHPDEPGGEARRGRPRVRDAGRLQPVERGNTPWGDYTPAIHRWAAVIGRPAPAPTDERGRLSPLLVEWMMGLPFGWVTDTPGLSRADMLRILGNGVVPQQAATAVSALLRVEERAA